MSRNLRLKGDNELAAMRSKLNYSGNGKVSVPVADIINSPKVQEQVAACRELQRKQSKYRNEPVVIDGERFDSKGEAERYLELKMLERAGEIYQLRRQVAFGLTVKGQLIGSYVADFAYVHPDLTYIVEDWKSPASKTPFYEWKKKHLLAEHGISIYETGRA